MSNPVVNWASEHPLAAGAAAVGVVVVAMLLFGGSGSSGGGSNSGAVQAYYAAVGAQSQAGSAVQMTQIQANAANNQALIAATYGLEREKISSASTDLATTTNAVTQQKAIDAAVAINQRNTEVQWHISDNTINFANEALGRKGLGKSEKTAIVQTALTGQIAPVTYNQGNSASAVIGSIGGAAGNIAKSIVTLGGLF